MYPSPDTHRRRTEQTKT